MTDETATQLALAVQQLRRENDQLTKQLDAALKDNARLRREVEVLQDQLAQVTRV